MNPDDLRALAGYVSKAQARGLNRDQINAGIARYTKGQITTYADLQRALRGDVAPVTVGDVARSLAQGATFNFADELRGAGAWLVPGGQGYQEARDEFRAKDAAFRSAHPLIATGAELAGGLLVPGFGAARVAGATARGAQDVGLLARGVELATQGAKVGAAYGGLAGAGAAEDLRAVPGSAVQGAAAGGLLGAVLSPAIATAGAAGQRAGQFVQELRNPALAATRTSADDLLRAMMQDGYTPAQAYAALGQLDQIKPGEAVLADVGGALRRTLRASKNLSPALEGEINSFVAARTGQKAGRVAGYIEEAGAPLAGGQPLTSAAVGEARQAAHTALRKRAAEIYPANDVPVEVGDAPLLRIPVVRSAMERATPEGRPQTWPDTHPTFGQLQQAERLLRGDAKAAYQSGNGASGALLNQRADALESLIATKVPSYPTMRAQYREAAGPYNAFGETPSESVGRDILSGNAADQIANVKAAMAHSNPQTIDAVRMTFVEDITNELRSLASNRTGGTMNALENLGNDRAELVRLLFPNQAEFDRFVQRMGLEKEMGHTVRAVAGNSTTSQQVSDMGEQAAGSAISGLVVGGVIRSLIRSAARGLLHSVNHGVEADAAYRTGRALLGRYGDPALERLLQDITQEMERARARGLTTSTRGAVGSGLLGQQLGGLTGTGLLFESTR